MLKSNKNKLSDYRKDQPTPPKTHLLIESNSSCNLGCKYCYAGKKKKTSSDKMDLETLENITKKFLKSRRVVEFLWHGAEPLNTKLGFYKKAMELQEKYKTPKNEINNSMQSNGTLINEEVAEFLKKHELCPGISLDGPKRIHNKTRIHKNGNGSFKDVMKGIKTLKNKDIDPGAIMVATKHTKGNVKEIYKFFKENEISIKINPFYSGGDGKESEEELLLTPKEMGELWIKFFNIWFNDKDHKIDIDPFKQIIEGFLTGQMKDCSYKKDACSNFFFIKPNGDVSICGGWSEKAGLKLGNINTDTTYDLITSHQHFKIEQKGKVIESDPDCKRCKWQELCYGGCSHISYEMKGNILEKDPFCKSRKMLFNHIYKEIRNNAETKVVKPIKKP